MPTDNLTNVQIANAIVNLEKRSKERHRKVAESIEMKKNFILPYTSNSLSAKKLSETSTFQLHQREYTYLAFEKVSYGSFTVINWGSTHKLPQAADVKIKYFNDPEKVSKVQHQETFLSTMKAAGISSIEHTTSIKEAISWHREGKIVLGKNRYGGLSTFDEDLNNFINAVYWTLYKKKTNEYRVHVAFGKVIAVQEKKLRERDHKNELIDPADVDFRFQTGENGFVLRKVPISDVQPRVLDIGLAAISAFNLDFGAIDIINNRVTKKSYAFGITTQPLLNEDLAVDYGNEFKKRLDNS